jgi:hypothetical protein
MLSSFMLSVDFNALSWEGVKFRSRASQRSDNYEYFYFNLLPVTLKNVIIIKSY